MELTKNYILSQIIIIIVHIFFALTYCVKKRKVILAFSFISNFLNSIAFILLGAYTSAAMCAISIFRDILFILNEKKYGKSDNITKRDVALLVLIYGISIISIILTFRGFWTLMYTVASMLYTYSIWQKNNAVYRFLGIPVNLISICDSIYIKSIVGVVLQCVVLITSTVGFVSYIKENKTKCLQEEGKNAGRVLQQV